MKSNLDKKAKNHENEEESESLKVVNYALTDILIYFVVLRRKVVASLTIVSVRLKDYLKINWWTCLHTDSCLSSLGYKPNLLFQKAIKVL